MADGTPTGTKPDRTLTTRRVVVTVLVIYVVLFILLNTRRISVSFVFFSVRTHLLTALLLIAVLSFVAGFFVRGWKGSGKLFGRAHPGPAASESVEPKT